MIPQDIHDIIDETCCKLLKRNIADPEHTLTTKLHFTTRTRSSIAYKPSVPKTKSETVSFRSTSAAYETERRSYTQIVTPGSPLGDKPERQQPRWMQSNQILQ